MDTTTTTTNTITITTPYTSTSTTTLNNNYITTSSMQINPNKIYYQAPYIYKLDKTLSPQIKNTSTSNKIMIYNKYLNVTVPYITQVKILNPEKVINFTFSDGTNIKTVCKDVDNFNFEFAFYLVYAKYLYKNILTSAGIEEKAKEFTNIIFFNSLVKKGMKVYLNQKKEEEKLEKAKAESKAIKERRIAKKIAKKAKAKETRIDEIAAAIKKAKKDEWISVTTSSR